MRGRGGRAGRPRRGRGPKKSCKRSSRQWQEGEPKDHALGRSRGGFGSKFHLVTDGKGTPLAVELTAGQVGESTRLESVVATFIASREHRRRRKPRKLAGDKGYSAARARDWLKARGIEPVIPHKDNEKARHDPAVAFDKETYRRRAVVEQCVGWLKEYRRIGTRYEKLAVNFHGMLQLAMIRRYLKLLFSDSA